MKVTCALLGLAVAAVAAGGVPFSREAFATAESAGGQVSDVERLVAVEEIEKLKARYGRMVDAMDADGLRNEVFTPDAVMDTEWPVDKSRKVVHGREDVIKWIMWSIPLSKKDWTANSGGHIATMPEIDILSSTTAKGLWRVGSGSFYRETYERIDGNWRIKTLRLERAPWYVPGELEKASLGDAAKLKPPFPVSDK